MVDKPLATYQSALAKIDKALQHVYDICRDRARWRMSIPANPEYDSDLILCEALESARQLLQSESRRTDPSHPEHDWDAAQRLPSADAGKTPRTNAFWENLPKTHGWDAANKLADFARQLERELSAPSSEAVKAKKCDCGAYQNSLCDGWCVSPSNPGAPVAWRWRWPAGDEPDVWTYTEDEPTRKDKIVYEPLYARSANAMTILREWVEAFDDDDFFKESAAKEKAATLLRRADSTPRHE